MKVRVLVGILVFLVVVNLAAIGTFLYVHFTRPERGARWAQEGRPGMRGGPGMPGGMFDGDHPMATLSKEDRRLLFDMMSDFREANREKMAQTRALEEEMFELMQQDPVPMARVDSLLEEIAATRLEVAKEATRRLLEMRESLTPEQRERLHEVLLRMHRMGGPPGFGKSGPGPRGRER